MQTRLLCSALALALGVLGGCAPGLIGEDVTRELAEQTIPGNPTANAAAVELQPLEMGSAPVLTIASDNPAVNSDGLTYILLRSIELDITTTAQPAGDSDCWDFVRSVTVYIESTRQGSTLPRLRIASGSAPGCVKSMPLTPVPDANLKPYTDTGFRVTAELAGVPPPDDVSFVTRLVLRAAVL